MTSRADIDRLRVRSAGRHKRNAAIADAARGLARKFAGGVVTLRDIVELAAVVQRVDGPTVRRDPENLDPYGAQNHPLPGAEKWEGQE